ncbi:MAG TPA: DMT family transporter [Thermoanaerobacterales bacterium]|uniref:DMT family transporter n=1 Tax=Tepidanaerobacter sp. GT38 TaxID=2722793 RepID=UPI0018596FAD|nr:DMT family transporter [Tepidanaerobacter sp. GT38]MCG1012224.1 DMT family transporter [Tepidanaerobacter sp. GT38]HHY42597.1 DMT family transporter [Thermoanaerobacterales bacterium]
MSDTLRVYIGLFGVAFFWGTSWAASKIGLQEFSPLHLTLVRFMAASVIFYCMVKLFYKDYVIEKQDKRRIWLLGLLGVSIYFLLQHTGLDMTTTVNSSILIATSPIFTMFLSAKLFRQEELTYSGIFGALLAFLGVFLVFTGGKGISIGRGTLIGDLLMLLNSVVWALFSVLGKDVVDKYDPFVVMAYAYLYGTITMLPFAFAPGFVASVKTASITTWAAVIYLALFCSVYSYYMWYKGIRILGASQTAMFNYINPVIAVIIGVIFLKEAWNVYTLIGGILVFLGVYITSASKGNFLKKESKSHLKS